MTKMLRIAINGRPVTESTDRVKTAYTMVDPDGRSMTARAPPGQTSEPAPQPRARSPPATQTTFSGRRVRFPARFNV